MAVGRCMAFAIPAAELAAWEQKLAAQKISIESTVRWPRSVSLYFCRNPDQNLIGLRHPRLSNFLAVCVWRKAVRPNITSTSSNTSSVSGRQRR